MSWALQIENYILKYINSYSQFSDFGHTCAPCRKYL